jgi:hypothetical protein
MTHADALAWCASIGKKILNMGNNDDFGPYLTYFKSDEAKKGANSYQKYSVKVALKISAENINFDFYVLKLFYFLVINIKKLPIKY